MTARDVPPRQYAAGIERCDVCTPEEQIQSEEIAANKNLAYLVMRSSKRYLQMASPVQKIAANAK